MPPDVTKLNLHRSRSTMSITPNKGDRSARAPPEFLSTNKICPDCVLLRRKCASCTLRRLLRQHIIGKLKVEDLKGILGRMFSEAEPEYKRTMVLALEHFKTSVKERKPQNSCVHNKIADICDVCLMQMKSPPTRRSKDMPPVKSRSLSLEGVSAIQQRRRTCSSPIPMGSGRTAEQQKLVRPSRNVDQRKQKQKPQQRKLKSPESSVVGGESPCSADTIQELFCKDRPRTNKPCEGSIRVIESAIDDDVFKMELAVEMEEKVKNLKSTQRQKRQSPMGKESRRYVEIIQDAIEMFQDTDVIVDMAEFADGLLHVNGHPYRKEPPTKTSRIETRITQTDICQTESQPAQTDRETTENKSADGVAGGEVQTHTVKVKFNSRVINTHVHIKDTQRLTEIIINVTKYNSYDRNKFNTAFYSQRFTETPTSRFVPNVIYVLSCTKARSSKYYTQMNDIRVVPVTTTTVHRRLSKGAVLTEKPPILF